MAWGKRRRRWLLLHDGRLAGLGAGRRKPPGQLGFVGVGGHLLRASGVGSSEGDSVCVWRLGDVSAPLGSPTSRFSWLMVWVEEGRFWGDADGNPRWWDALALLSPPPWLRPSQKSVCPVAVGGLRGMEGPADDAVVLRGSRVREAAPPAEQDPILGARRGRGHLVLFP